VRMATVVAGFGLHVARGFFAGHPGGNRIAMPPKVWLASFTSSPFSTALTTRIRKS
jgi:hypothetical protein